jgi:hypothetical protein
VFATRCVEAAIRSNEALYRLATENMRLDYFIDIFCSNPAVPNCVGVYNDIRSMFALVKAAGFVGADFVLEAACCEFPFEHPLQFACSARIATSSRMAGRALINADEDMLLKLRHLINLTNFERFVAKPAKQELGWSCGIFDCCGYAALSDLSSNSRVPLTSVRFVATVIPAL